MPVNDDAQTMTTDLDGADLRSLLAVFPYLQRIADDDAISGMEGVEIHVVLAGQRYVVGWGSNGEPSVISVQEYT